MKTHPLKRLVPVLAAAALLTGLSWVSAQVGPTHLPNTSTPPGVLNTTTNIAPGVTNSPNVAPGVSNRTDVAPGISNRPHTPGVSNDPSTVPGAPAATTPPAAPAAPATPTAPASPSASGTQGAANNSQ